MTRTEALEKFRVIHSKETEELANEFISGIETGVDELMDRILRAFGEIADQAEEADKSMCVFFLFSLLRYDLLQNTAKIRLDVMDARWYLDKNPLYAECDLTFLFAPYFKWRADLLIDMREYMGKVNKYDVEHMVQQEIMVAVGRLTQILRILFRSIESQENFARIPKGMFWEIRFGEYRDYNELIMQMNREPRSEENWLDKLRDDEDDEESSGKLQFTWWYEIELTSGNCQGRDLDFVAFEKCTLKDIDFEKAQMTGARFLNCKLERCSLKKANLTQAEFESCEFLDCDFTEAGLQQAVFSMEGLKEEWFDDKQKEEMLIVEEVEA